MHIHEKNWLILKNEASKKKLENTLHPQLYGLTRWNLIFQLLHTLPIRWHMSAEIILIWTRHNYGYLHAIDNPLLRPYK